MFKKNIYYFCSNKNVKKVYLHVMNNHFFSIIVCCYNSAKYLEKTILSVVNQNYTNWELILIDNGSTDKTESIINKYIETNKNIFI